MGHPGVAVADDAGAVAVWARSLRELLQPLRSPRPTMLQPPSSRQPPPGDPDGRRSRPARPLPPPRSASDSPRRRDREGVHRSQGSRWKRWLDRRHGPPPRAHAGPVGETIGLRRGIRHFGKPILNGGAESTRSHAPILLTHRPGGDWAKQQTDYCFRVSLWLLGDQQPAGLGERVARSLCSQLACEGVDPTGDGDQVTDRDVTTARSSAAVRLSFVTSSLRACGWM